MDNEKINEIQDILQDEEFKVGGFEFKLDIIRGSWTDTLFFDFKVHNPNDESFCCRCLEDLLFSELKPYFKYFGIREQVRVNIYDKNKKLEDFYITDDFINGLFDEIKKINNVDFYSDFDELRLKIKQKPTKITLEELNLSTVLQLDIYAKYIDHHFTRSGSEVTITSLVKGSTWDIFKNYNNINSEEWYDEIVTNYFNKFTSMECVSLLIKTNFN